MHKKIARLPQRSFDISESERAAAKEALSSFKHFLQKLWAARQSDKKLIDVLEKNQSADSSSLFEIRHLLRKFQQEHFLYLQLNFCLGMFFLLAL
jgi:hypothetical protein